MSDRFPSPFDGMCVSDAKIRVLAGKGEPSKFRLNHFRSYKDNVLILPDSGEDRRTDGGLYLPDSWENSRYGSKVLSGVILDAGPGGYGTCGETGKTKFFQVDVMPGERVLFGHEAGEAVIIGDFIDPKWFPEFEPGTELRIMREAELLAVV